MYLIAVLERLAPHVEGQVNLVINSEQEAASLSSRLNNIKLGLEEAERKGVTDRGVKNWLKQLEDVAYELDDVLDELDTANLQVVVQDPSLHWKKVCSLLCSCFYQLVSRCLITQKMKKLSGRIDTILSQKPEYTLVPSENDRAQEFRQEASTSLLSNEFKAYGLEDVEKSFLGKLDLKGVGSDGWVSVPQALDALAMAKAILESFGEKSEDAHTLEALVQRIKSTVNNKRFLLVLDNVWIEDRNKLLGVKDCLKGGKGSRIVVTTRLESVARMMATDQWQSLGLLSDLDCGTILNGVALEGREGEDCGNLRVIGMEIAKKCNGLPLAAKSVGSMLALRYSESEWMDVMESPLWKDEDKPSDLFRLLNLSYTDLSPLLKRCLLSTVVFPKGAFLSIDEISRVWMAYGYLNSKGTVDEVRSKGLQYLNNLAMRSFFQRVARDDGYDKRMSYKMHDIIHDFATYLTGSDGYYFIRDEGLAKERSPPSHINLPWNSLGRFRTFSVCREELVPHIFSHLTSVRMLSLRDCKLLGLPEDIGELIHLRYLNVSGNPITQLPETVTDLCNLQTLDVGSCSKLSSLPEGIEKLINLRHLLNSYTPSLVEFPQGLEKLSGLWTLSDFSGSDLGRLRNLNQLQRSLLLNLENLNETELRDPELWKKEHIKKLVLLFRMNEEVDQVVEVLKPPPNLQSLEIYSGWGKWLSHWLYTSSFNNLKAVTLYGRGKHSHMPPIGKLPALEELEILFCRIIRLSNEFLGLEDASSSLSSRQVAGGFPKLKKLRFYCCGRWEEWEDIEEESVPVMPLLEELQIEMCRRLKGLPHNLLGKASTLRVVKLIESQSLCQRYNKKSGFDRDRIPLLPNQIWTVDEVPVEEEDSTEEVYLTDEDDWTEEVSLPDLDLTN